MLNNKIKVATKKLNIIQDQKVDKPQIIKRILTKPNTQNHASIEEINE
jgi:hypothetical protein